MLSNSSMPFIRCGALIKPKTKKLNIGDALDEADRHSAEGRLDLARGIYTAILKAQPSNIRANDRIKKLETSLYEEENRIHELYLKGANEKVEELCLRFKKRGGRSAVITNLLAFCLHARGRLTEAADSFKQAIEINPGYADSYSNLAMTLYELGQVEEALSYCDQAIEKDPSHAGAYNIRGNCFRGVGNLKEAIKNYKKSIESNPNYAVSYSNLGNALGDEKKIEEAIEAFQKAIELKPDFLEAHTSLLFLLSQTETS